MPHQLNEHLPGFACQRCHRTYPVNYYAADRDLGYPACLEDGYPASLTLTYADDHLWTLPVGERGLRCYAVRLPYRSFPTLGEGDKPLVPLPDLAEELDLEALWPKNEGANPASRGFVLVKNGRFSQ